MNDHEMLELIADYLDQIGNWDDFKSWYEEQGYKQENMPTPFNKD